MPPGKDKPSTKLNRGGRRRSRITAGWVTAVGGIRLFRDGTRENGLNEAACVHRGRFVTIRGAGPASRATDVRIISGSARKLIKRYAPSGGRNEDLDEKCYAIPGM